MPYQHSSNTQTFFQFNIIAFQFIIFLFFCLWKWHSRNFLFYFVYTMLVFVGLKKLWIWEKVRRTAHVILAQLHVPCTYHYWDFFFLFRILFFLSLSALLLLCRHVEAPFCSLCAVKNNGMKRFFFIIKYVADSSFIIIKFSFILLILMCIHHSYTLFSPFKL